jgi:hypothetical protein
LAEVVAFVREFTRAGRSTAVSGNTRIEADLGITGDDGSELLATAEERFGADFGDDLRTAFRLGPEEFLFHSEGTPIPGADVLSRWLTGSPRPNVRDLTVDELHQAILRCTVASPEPPFLVIRPGVAFWIERAPHSRVRATLQAYRDGCYDGADFIDGRGGAWPVVSASLREAPPPLAWATPAKLMRVKVRLGPRQDVQLGLVVSRLSRIVLSGSEFCDHIRIPPDSLVTLLEECASISEVIGVVEAHAT